MRQSLPFVSLCAAATLAISAYAKTLPANPAIAKAVAAPSRPEAERARDQYRHPAETLSFMGLKPGQRLVELSPGGGWYTGILAQAIGPTGTYTALVTSPRGAEGASKVMADKQVKGGVAILNPATGSVTSIAPGSQDIVLTFRNVHNLLMADNPAAASNAFKAWHTMLKPGGVLGIEEHRLPESRDTAAEKNSGYVKTSTVVALATAAGFRLAGTSEVNANPKDTADHPKGVWTLPPTYQLKDVDRAKYAAIGESDRMTLKFVKPK